MSEPGYLRQPTLHQEALVFICDDDLWRVDAGGGVARRLSAGLGEPATPALSPDGCWIAFVGRDEQHPEVYVMPAGGGPARRLTWLGPDVLVRGWTPDGRILFVTTHGQPFFRNYRAHAIGLTDALPTLLPYGQVDHLAFGPASAARKRALVVGRNTADPARWKRYRGGTAGHLWIDAEGNGGFRRMTELAGNITSPMWVDGRLYFLSDFEGTGNLYSCRTDGGDVRRHSDHDGFYARHAQTDGRRIVYQCAARIWMFDPVSGRGAPVDIDVAGHRTQAARRHIRAADHLQGFHLHPAGHSLALEVRGRPCTLALWEGAVRQPGAADGARYRHPQWLADASTLVATSDESGEERLVVFDAGGARSLPWDIGRVLALRAAPWGRLLALANHRNEVMVADLDREQLQTIDRSTAARTEELAWSPDGQWLAYPLWTSFRHCAIRLYSVGQGRAATVTAPEFRDYSPAFDPDGKYLYFLSVRTFDPVYDNVQFELSFPRGARPYLIALQADQRPPFDPEPRGLEPDEAAGGKAQAGLSAQGGREERGDSADGSRHGSAGRRAPNPLRVDLEGIADRVAAFPVAEARYGRLDGLPDRKLVWTVLPIVGARGAGGHAEEPGRLEVFDFATGKAQQREGRVDAFALSADGSTMVVRDGKRLRAIAPGRVAPLTGDAQPADDAPSRVSGWIDLARVRLAVDPRAEWRQMLREVWRLQRDQFWVADMSGVDWDAEWRRYSPLVERVSTRGELSDLIWELQGELGTSHAYESGGDHRKPPALALGMLAAELRFAGDEAAQDAGQRAGYEIVQVVQGDPWDAAADSPLNAIGVQARPGERIVAVNGQPVTRGVPPQALLVNQARARVELTLAAADGGTTRNVLVHTLADEAPARYRSWVEANRRRVHEQSSGRVGYLHLPDMMAAGFAEFHRYFPVECDRGGLVVDLRYNRGGHVSQLLLEKLARRRLGYDVSRWGQPQPYPLESVLGPIVALTNEHAGSDGDIFSHCFKLMGLGPLVGKRTWGGVIGIWPRHLLVDGTETTQPEFSFWFRDVGWSVENYGTDPDIEIDNAPQDTAEGRDRQLDRSVEVALQLVEAADLAPRFGPRPVLARAPLPPRKGFP